MPFQFRCTCGQILQADESQQGQPVNCPYCATLLTIPILNPQPQAPFAPPGGQFPGAPSAPNPFAPPGGQPNFAPPAWPGAQQPPGPPGYAQPPFPPQPFAPPGPQGMPSSGYAPPGPPFGNPQSAPAFAPSPWAPAPGPEPSTPNFPFLGSAPGMVDPGKALGEGMKPPGDWEEEEKLETAIAQLWHIPCPKGHILETPDEMLDEEVECPYCQTQFVLKHFNSVEATEKRERERELRDQRSGELWLKWSIGIAVVVVLGLIVLIATR